MAGAPPACHGQHGQPLRNLAQQDHAVGQGNHPIASCRMRGQGGSRSSIQPTNLLHHQASIGSASLRNWTMIRGAGSPVRGAVAIGRMRGMAPIWARAPQF